MDQEKIGRFIAKVRKKKNMTQQELADKLHVTDRAIGNWENGRRMPDYSIIKELCNELGITINELLAGEYIKENDKEKQFEKNYLNLLKKSFKNHKRNIIIISLSIIIILISTLIITRDIFIKKGYIANPSLAYTSRYEKGKENQQGEVNYDRFENISLDFEIGANKYGYAVFKNPTKAIKRLKKDYSKGLKAIQKEFNLLPLNMFNYKEYGTYGWQLTTGTNEEKEQAQFISDFFDIYDNSFN